MWFVDFFMPSNCALTWTEVAFIAAAAELFIRANGVATTTIRNCTAVLHSAAPWSQKLQAAIYYALLTNLRFIKPLAKTGCDRSLNLRRHSTRRYS